MLSAWVLLAAAIMMRVHVEIVGAGIIFLFVFGMFKSSFEPTVQMLRQPSLDHVIGFMISKAFLVALVGYFALLASSYSVKLQTAERRIDERESDIKYIAEDAKKWQRLYEESRQPKDVESDRAL